MSRFIRYSFLIIGAFLTVNGCKEDEGLILMEIVALNASNAHEFSLQIVQSDPKNNPFSSTNEDLFLVAKTKIMLSDLPQMARESGSFKDLRDRLRKSFGDEPVTVLATKRDGVYRGTTFESMLALSSFHHILQIMKFARNHEMLKDLSPFDPLKMSLYGDIFITKKSTFPLASGDNAFYIGSADTLVLLPVSDNEGLPISMHEGVLAHEYHHRIFFNRVWLNNGSADSWHRYQLRFNDDRTESFNRSERLLAATDEALADIFAVAYTSLPDYLSLSLTTPRGDEVKDQRDLNGHFAEMATYDLLARPRDNEEIINTCGHSKNFTSASFNFYCLATVIAKVFYEACEKDIGKMRTLVLPTIGHAQSAIATALAQGRDYTPDILLEAAAQQAKLLDKDFHKKLCQQYKKRFASLIARSRIPSCAL